MGSVFWHSALITITSHSPGESMLLPELEEDFLTSWWAPIRVADTLTWAPLGIAGTCLARACKSCFHLHGGTRKAKG